MKKLKSLVSCLSLVAVMALAIVPAKSVYAVRIWQSCPHVKLPMAKSLPARV